MNDTFTLRRSILCVSMAGTIAASCGSPASHFDSVGSTDDSSSDAGTGSDAGKGSASSSGGAVFLSDDDATAASASDCMPGTYSGPFKTQVFIGDAGPGPFALMWTGTLTVTLVAKSQTVTGGELPTTTLTIAPGGRLQGTDNFNGTFGADVTGQLDCSSKKLSATISNGVYLILNNDASSIAFDGTAEGTYSKSTPPALAGSIYIVTTDQGPLGDLGATGTVTATLQ
jgi:hypothetical protein